MGAHISSNTIYSILEATFPANSSQFPAMSFFSLTRRLYSAEEKCFPPDFGQFCVIPMSGSQKHLVCLSQRTKDFLGDIVYIELKPEGSKINKGGIRME
jgi:hypothetical protein